MGGGLCPASQDPAPGCLRLGDPRHLRRHPCLHRRSFSSAGCGRSTGIRGRSGPRGRGDGLQSRRGVPRRCADPGGGGGQPFGAGLEGARRGRRHVAGICVEVLDSPGQSLGRLRLCEGDRSLAATSGYQQSDDVDPRRGNTGDCRGRSIGSGGLHGGCSHHGAPGTSPAGRSCHGWSTRSRL